MSSRVSGLPVLPTRVFISFDYDNDRALAVFLGEQLRKSTRFSVQNWSMQEAAPERLWPEEAERRLNRSDVMLIVLGTYTHRAPGVLTEVQLARGLTHPVPIRQIIGRRGSSPTPVPSGGRVYRWGHDNLETVLDVPRRRA
jgi:TIR domain